MLAFGVALADHNEFLGFEGDMDAGAASCYRTAALFCFFAIASAITFAIGAVRAKMGHGPSTRPEYASV